MTVTASPLLQLMWIVVPLAHVPLAVEGTWAEWHLWGPCSVSCGSGQQRYIRYCEGPLILCNLKKYDVEFRDCPGLSECLPTTTPDPCPVCVCDSSLCQWTPWSSWNQCTATCGTSTHRRTRKIVGAAFCYGRQTEHRLCNLNACPSWSEWSSWSICQPDCNATIGTGKEHRKRQCMPIIDSQEPDRRCKPDFDTGALNVHRRPCQFNNSAGIEVFKDICGLRDDDTTVQVTATVTAVVGRAGYIFICAVCAVLLVVFTMDCNFTTQRAFHIPQELSLFLAHVVLIFMDVLHDDELHCYIIAMMLNGSFLVYFTFLFMESCHIMAFLSHVVRKNGIMPLFFQYFLVILAIGGTMALYWIYLKQDLVTVVYDVDPNDDNAVFTRKLCWMRHCRMVDKSMDNRDDEKQAKEDEIDEYQIEKERIIFEFLNTTVGNLTEEHMDNSCSDMMGPRIWFLVHAGLVAMTMVATESGNVQRRHYPYALPCTNWKQYSDAKVAWSGLYLKLFIGMTSMVATLQAELYQVEHPADGMVFFWSTASLACCIALGCCIGFFHSLGNAAVREKIKRKFDKLCGRKRRRRKKRKKKREREEQRKRKQLKDKLPDSDTEKASTVGIGAF